MKLCEINPEKTYEVRGLNLIAMLLEAHSSGIEIGRKSILNPDKSKKQDFSSFRQPPCSN